MKKSISILLMLAATALVFNGCATTGLTASSHLTNVQLGSPNFRIVATSVSGEASAQAILGVSVGFGLSTTQLALIPLESKRMLYKTAMQNLWSGFEAVNGPVTGRKLALTNVRFDSEALNLLVYTKITTVIVADVVEFQ